MTVETDIQDALAAEEANDLQAAEGIWAAVRQEAPSLAEGYLSGGRVLTRLDRHAEAVQVLQTGRALIPQNEWIAIDLAYAVQHHDGHAAARDQWENVVRSFPQSLPGHLGAGYNLRQLREHDQAEAIYQDILAHHPDEKDALIEYAWCANDTGNADEEFRRWAVVRAKFPEYPITYIRLSEIYRQRGDAIASDEVMANAAQRFYNNVEIRAAHARLAQFAGHWAEALRRAERMIADFPKSPEGRRIAARALMELGRLNEAATILAPALRQFPEDAELAEANAWLATRRLKPEEAQHAWQDIRQRFPDNPAGYVGCALASRGLGHPADALAMLTVAIKRFPDHAGIIVETARTEQMLGHMNQAADRWFDLISRHPENPTGYIGLSDCAAAMGDPEGAERVLQAGFTRNPRSLELFAAAATMAERMEKFPRSLALWNEITRDFPGHPRGTVGFARAVRLAGHLEQSAAILEREVPKFPGDIDMATELALTLSYLRRWPEAMKLWSELKHRYPDSRRVSSGIAEIRELALIHQAAGEGEQFEIPPSLLAPEAAAAAQERAEALLAVFRRFESLGDDCEFGMVQRMFGVDSVGLLRWTSVSPANLVAAMNANFEGVGDQKQTRVDVVSDEYRTEDTRFALSSHTFTPASSEPIERFTEDHCRRMRWLRMKLLRELASAKKIFVYKTEHAMPEAALQAVFTAVRRFNLANNLFVVRLATPEHPSGTVERVGETLFLGYLDRFSTVDISVDAWVSICQNVAQHFPAEEVEV